MSSATLQAALARGLAKTPAIRMEVAIATVFYERLLRYPKEWRVVTAYDSSLTADWLLGYADAIAQGRRVWPVPVLRNRIKHLDVVHKLLTR